MKAKPITTEAIQAVAFILLCENGVDAVDACNALLNGQAANQLARLAEGRFKSRAIHNLMCGWLPRGWKV